MSEIIRISRKDIPKKRGRIAPPVQKIPSGKVYNRKKEKKVEYV